MTIDLDPNLRGPMPHHPQVLDPVKLAMPFDDPNYIFEIKWDGFRTLAEVEKGQVDLYSDNSTSYNHRYPSIVSELKEISHDVVLDGELVVLKQLENKKLYVAFEELKAYRRINPDELFYFVFDMLFIDGYDIRTLSLLKRKELLKNEVIPQNSTVQYVDHVEEYGIDQFSSAAAAGFEGIVAKQAQSRYLIPENDKDIPWKKVKAYVRHYWHPQRHPTEAGKKYGFTSPLPEPAPRIFPPTL